MLTTFTRAEQARVFLTMREAFGLSDDNPSCSKEAVLEGIADAIAHHSNGASYSLAEVFALAEAVLFQRDEVCGTSRAIYDMESLSVAVGTELAMLTVKLCGGYAKDNKRVDDGDGRAVLVTFPETFFADHLREWSGRV